MKLYNKIIVSLLLIISVFSTQEAKAIDCSYPDWADAHYTTYAVGDTVSYQDVDWEVIGTTHTWVPPALTGSGAVSWKNVGTPCLSSTEPILGITSYTSKYCRTAYGVSEITGNGGFPVLSRGMVLSTSPGADISDVVVVDDYTGIGVMSLLLEDLAPGTKYYINGYATNVLGTDYGTESSFTTMDDLDCEDCTLACDLSDPTLVNTLPTIIAYEDTVCITEDITTSLSIDIYGTLKLCNNAQITLVGASISPKTDVSKTDKGQIVFEGCNELFIGTGSYDGYTWYPNGIFQAEANDPAQMVSFCSSCDDTKQDQFLPIALIVDHWAVGCRPESSLLPVELTYFTATKDGEGAMIEWETASEINNNYFEVQTSIDGETWITIAIVQGAGNSSDVNNYSFYDNEPGAGIQYYRLKQVDYDGESALSNVQHVKFDEEARAITFTAYNKSTTEIGVHLPLNGIGTVNLIDSRGRLIGSQSFASVSDKGTNLIFDKSNLESGIYYVNLVTKGLYLSEKISVIK
tara:strand:- start:891 stop:2447 length:1557 start_codon:yes stop_codon:yes gene_type:complete